MASSHHIEASGPDAMPSCSKWLVSSGSDGADETLLLALHESLGLSVINSLVSVASRC